MPIEQKQNLTGKSVLLVDDRPDNITLLKLALKSERFIISEALTVGKRLCRPPIKITSI